MIFITKSNLIYEENYNWTVYDNDHPKINGSPDNTQFNPNEGYEVMYLITEYMNKYEINKNHHRRKIEKMIRHHLPNSIVNQKNTIKWIKENWDNY